MKRLILFRHAKSDWHADYDSDHRRPLNERGTEAARAMGRYLARAESLPELVLSSSATRARETVRLAADAGGWECRVEILDELYLAPPERTLEIVRGCDDDVGTLLLAGHEPGWSLLAGGLAGNASIKMPTAAMVRLDLSVRRWKKAEYGLATLVWLMTPKLLARL